MDWNQEVLKSAIWLGKAYVVTLLVFVAVMFLIVKFTRWGRQFWAISGDYFVGPRGPRTLLGVALILFFVLLSVRMNVLFSFWYNDFYSSLQALDAPKFWFGMKLFGLLAALHVARALLNAYIQQAFSIHWREWLNDRLVSHWLDGQAYYLGRFASPAVDNPDQRIQQDATNLVSTTLGLSMGLVGSVVSMIEFTAILWNLSASMTLLGYEVPRAMVFLVYIYGADRDGLCSVDRPAADPLELHEREAQRHLPLPAGAAARVRREHCAVPGEAVERRSLMAGFAP